MTKNPTPKPKAAKKAAPRKRTPKPRAEAAAIVAAPIEPPAPKSPLARLRGWFAAFGSDDPLTDAED